MNFSDWQRKLWNWDEEDLAWIHFRATTRLLDNLNLNLAENYFKQQVNYDIYYYWRPLSHLMPELYRQKQHYDAATQSND